MPVYPGDGPPRVDEDLSALLNRSQSQPRSSNHPTPADHAGSGARFLVIWTCIALFVWFVLPSYETILDTVQTYNLQSIKQKISQVGPSLLSNSKQTPKKMIRPVKRKQKPAAIQKTEKERNLSEGSSFKVTRSVVSTTYNSNDLESLGGQTS